MNIKLKNLLQIMILTCVAVFVLLSQAGCGREEPAKKDTGKYIYRIAFASF